MLFHWLVGEQDYRKHSVLFPVFKYRDNIESNVSMLARQGVTLGGIRAAYCNAIEHWQNSNEVTDLETLGFKFDWKVFALYSL